MLSEDTRKAILAAISDLVLLLRAEGDDVLPESVQEKIENNIKKNRVLDLTTWRRQPGEQFEYIVLLPPGTVCPQCHGTGRV